MSTVMPAEAQTPPPKQAKGRRRAVKKTHDASAQAGLSDIGSYDQEPQYSDGYGYMSPNHSMEPAGGVRGTTPRKRQGKGTKNHAPHNGYRSDTGPDRRNQGHGTHTVGQSVDMTGAYTQAALPQQASMTPVKQQVYAGPAFFASPAASALPMPKGFGPKPAAAESDLARQSSGSEASFRSPAPSTTADATRGGSPLDMLFKADREEKSRKGSPASTASPLAQIHSAPRNFVRSPPQGRRGATPHGTSSKAMLMAEMDGSSEQSDSDEPNRDVSFQERMRGVAQGKASLDPTDSEHMQRQAKTHALKQLLMAPPPSQSRSHPGLEPPLSAPSHGGFASQLHQAPPPLPPPQPHQHPQPQQHHPYHQLPQHIHQQSHSGFAQYGPHHGQAHTIRPSAASPSPQDLRSMEENLRKVLKLGPGS